MKSRQGPDYQHLRTRLVEARQASGLTQSQVAEQLGKPQSYVSKCETGERRVDVVELAQFAQIYAQPLDSFVAQQARRRRGRTRSARYSAGRRRSR